MADRRPHQRDRPLAKPSRPKSKTPQEPESRITRPVLHRRDTEQHPSRKRIEDERDERDHHRDDRGRSSKSEKKEDRSDRPKKASGLSKVLGATDDIDALLALLASQDPKRGALAMEGFERVWTKDREVIYSKGQVILTGFLQRIESLVRNPPSDAKDKQRAWRNMDAMVKMMYVVTHQKDEPRGEKLLVNELCTQQNLTILSTCLEQFGDTVIFAQKIIISGFNMGGEIPERIRKASIPQLVTYQLKFRDTTLELSALLTLVAVLVQDKENARVCVDKAILPTLVELLSVEEPRLNYQAVTVAGLLCTYASDTQDFLRKEALNSIVKLVQDSPGGSAARFFVLEAVSRMIDGNKANTEAFFAANGIVGITCIDSLTPSRPPRERIAALKIYRQFVKLDHLLATGKTDALLSDAGVKRREFIVKKGGVAPLFPLINSKKTDDQHKEIKDLANNIADQLKSTFPKEVEFAASMFPKRYPSGVEEESEEEVPDIQSATSENSLTTP